MGMKRKRETNDSLNDGNAKKKTLNSEVKNVPPVVINYPPFIEKPTGDELKREVALYEKLASEDESERLDAADTVVSGLIGGDGATEPTLLRHLERRLFRGLASGRKGARLGYSIVLTEILSQLYGPVEKNTGNRYTGLDFEKIFLLLKVKTKPEGDLNGQELKDHVLGFLFGLQCFVRAQILFLDTERWKLVLQEIFGLGKKKPWIREECGWMVVEALEQMDQGQAQITLQILCNQGFSRSPEGVGIWITARKRFPSIEFQSLPKVWGQSANPLEHLKSLAKVLKESSEPDQGVEANQTGSWNAKLHFVWDIIFEQFASALQEKDECCETDFKKFWKVAVDDTLFATNASKERKFWGFLLFQKVLQNVQDLGSAISNIFSPNLMRCLINHSQDKDRFLNRAAERSLKIVIVSVQKNSQILPDVLLQLVGSYGTYSFDRITKTRTLSQLLDLITEDNCANVIMNLENLAITVSGDNESAIAKEAESRRLMLGDYLLQIIRKPLTKNETASKIIRSTALSALARFTYCGIVNADPIISEKIRVLFQNRLASAFNHVLTDLGDYRYACDLLKRFEPSAVKMDPGLQAVKENALSTLQKILKKLKKLNDEEKAPLQAMGLLYALIIFQLYNGEPEAVTCLDELDLCFERLIQKKYGESKPQASEVLVELLLSFISRPSALLRKVAQLVFGAFVSYMTKDGLELMTDVLATSESVRGQQELFDQEDEGVIESQSGENNMDSDVEVIDMGTNKDSHTDHSTGVEDSTNDEEDSDEEKNDEESSSSDAEAERLNAALVNILGTNPDSANSDDDSDMTDSEMIALDAKLEEIFSQRKAKPNKKKEQKDAKENITNFKTRVLDLLEIYVKKQAHNELAFNLILPLLSLIRTTKAKKLAEKAHAIINSFARAYKGLSNSELTIPTSQVKLLRQIHEEANRNSSHAFCKAASSASLLVVSSMFRVDVGLLQEAADVYRDTQVKWVLGEAKIHAAFFTEWVNWCQSHASRA